MMRLRLISRSSYKLKKLLIEPPKCALSVYAAPKVLNGLGNLTDNALEEMIQDNRTLKLSWTQEYPSQITLDSDVQSNDTLFYNKETVLQYLRNYKSHHPTVANWIESSLQNNQNSSNLQDLNLKIAVAESLIQENEVSIKELKNLQEPDITFQDLFSSVIALSLWSDIFLATPANSKEIIVQNKPQMLLLETLESLTNISCKKIIRNQEDKEVDATKISDLWRRLALAKAWLHVQPFPNKGGYPFQLVNRSTSEKNAGCSRRFFSKFDPETFLDFAKIIFKMAVLPLDFHAYYAVYKFHEFFAYYDITEISRICKSFVKHRITVQYTHPITKSLHRKSMLKIIEEMPDIEKDVFVAITNFNSMNKAIFENEMVLKLLEKAVFVESPVILIRCLALILPLEDAEKISQSRQEVEEICRKIVKNLNSKSEKISYVEISFLLDLNSKNLLHLISMDDIKKWLIENEFSTFESKKHYLPQILLKMSLHDVFDERLFKRMLNDPRLFKKKQEEYSLLPSLLHSNDRNRHVMVRRMIGELDGICKHVKGRDYLKLCQKTRRSLKNQDDLVHPTQLKNYYKNHTGWEAVVSQVPDLICKRQNLSDVKKYVAETSIYHFFGFTDFIFCLNSKGSLMALPESFLEQDIKVIPEDMKHLQWFTLRTCSSRVINEDTFYYYLKITRELGYHVCFFDYFSHSKESDNDILHRICDEIDKIVPCVH